MVGVPSVHINSRIRSLNLHLQSVSRPKVNNKMNQIIHPEFAFYGE